MNIEYRAYRCPPTEQRGQTSAEFAIAFAAVALLIFGLIVAARAVYAKHNLANAAGLIAGELTQLSYPGLVYCNYAQTAVQDAYQKGNITLNSGDFVLYSSTEAWCQPVVSALPNGYVIPMYNGFSGKLDSSGNCVASGGTGASCQAYQSLTGDVEITATPTLDTYTQNPDGTCPTCPTSIAVSITQNLWSAPKLVRGFSGITLKETVVALTRYGQES